MKQLFIYFFILTSTCVFAQKSEQINVVTHNRTTIVCDASKGLETYSQWGVFPKENISVRKIMMKVTLGSPDSISTAHWDYLDHISIRRKGGINGKSLNYELGRMLTPYGSIYGKGWSWQWEVDVTDFSPFLRDSVVIEYAHSGYEDKSVGWTLTINFEITTGPEVIKPLGIVPLWNGSFKYGNPEEKIEENLLPITFQTDSKTKISRIRIQHTGHGMDRPKNCSEFCSRWRELKVDSEQVDFRNMWKDCGNNPLYPQGGTWLYDRAYWCPGDLQVPDIIDVKTSEGTHKIEIMMEPYTATENIQAVENISSYLFFYSSPTNKIDAAVDKIIVPSNEQQFSRLNPAGFNPRFIIRNLGSDNLKSATIIYGTEGFKQSKYSWKGNLKFNETAEIVLPVEIDSKRGLNKFSVLLTKPNGKKDAWTGDNELISTFDAPKLYPTSFILQFMTNNKPEDNEVTIVSSENDTIFSKKPIDLKSNTLYQDTIKLNSGKYELCLKDSAGDGLEFWAEPQNGNGYLRMLDKNGNLIHTFESDCGNGEKLNFIASDDFVTDTTKIKTAFSVYPRLVKDNVDLEMVANRFVDMQVHITVNAKVYEKHDYNNIKRGKYKYNFDNIPKGRIVIDVLINGKSKFKARLNKI